MSQNIGGMAPFVRMPGGRNQMYYPPCPEMGPGAHMNRPPFFHDDKMANCGVNSYDGRMGGMPDFKPPMMANPEPPPPAKKKRRTANHNNAANQITNHQPPPSVQDIAPPPPSGYGDTIVASNPFDDSPSMHVGLGRGLPPLMMGGGPGCNMAGSPMGCGPPMSPMGMCGPGPGPGPGPGMLSPVGQQQQQQRSPLCGPQGGLCGPGPNSPHPPLPHRSPSMGSASPLVMDCMSGPPRKMPPLAPNSPLHSPVPNGPMCSPLPTPLIDIRPINSPMCLNNGGGPPPNMPNMPNMSSMPNMPNMPPNMMANMAGSMANMPPCSLNSDMGCKSGPNALNSNGPLRGPPTPGALNHQPHQTHQPHQPPPGQGQGQGPHPSHPSHPLHPSHPAHPHHQPPPHPHLHPHPSHPSHPSHPHHQPPHPHHNHPMGHPSHPHPAMSMGHHPPPHPQHPGHPPPLPPHSQHPPHPPHPPHPSHPSHPPHPYPPTKPLPVSAGKVYPVDQPMVFNPQNPNAPPIYPCGVCHKEVHDNDQAILCESGCNFWFHRICTGLTEAAYQLLTAEVYAEWVCDKCLSSKNIPLVKFKP